MLLSTCSKIKYYPDVKLNPLSCDIAHRGGRNNTFPDNTLAGCKAALAMHDGVEVDIQISKDRSIWLSHSVEATDGFTSVGCFPELRDEEIEGIDSADGNPVKYSKLEDLIAWMAANAPNKYLCVDLKGWVPCSGNHLDIDGMMRLEAEIVAQLGKKYLFDKQILIETETITTLAQARKFSDEIGLYLNNYGKLEKGMLMALKYRLHGISFKANFGDSLSREYVDLYHKKGLRIIAWNLRNPADLNQMRNMGIDFIEYDFP
ncbi:MAG: glycerophosphodiester phosphodiesterase [Bacteroidetes bacterium]|nr:glycerophosphodiester phosphodiesterase [Bacteroidota bacterium]